jgi:streptomycin 6-kinase
MSEYPHGRAWLERLPTLAAACIEQWSLVPEEPIGTGHSLVIPAGDAILKLNPLAEPEAEHEPDALEQWKGRGAARLLARDDERWALLIERCRPGRQL